MRFNPLRPMQTKLVLERSASTTSAPANASPLGSSFAPCDAELTSSHINKSFNSLKLRHVSNEVSPGDEAERRETQTQQLPSQPSKLNSPTREDVGATEQISVVV